MIWYLVLCSYIHTVNPLTYYTDTDRRTTYFAAKAANEDDEKIVLFTIYTGTYIHTYIHTYASYIHVIDRKSDAVFVTIMLPHTLPLHGAFPRGEFLVDALMLCIHIRTRKLSNTVLT